MEAKPRKSPLGSQNLAEEHREATAFALLRPLDPQTSL